MRINPLVICADLQPTIPLFDKQAGPRRRTSSALSRCGDPPSRCAATADTVGAPFPLRPAAAYRPFNVRSWAFDVQRSFSFLSVPPPPRRIRRFAFPSTPPQSTPRTAPKPARSDRRKTISLLFRPSENGLSPLFPIGFPGALR